jgi:hypothetical protein
MNAFAHVKEGREIGLNQAAPVVFAHFLPRERKKGQRDSKIYKGCWVDQKNKLD